MYQRQISESNKLTSYEEFLPETSFSKEYNEGQHKKKDGGKVRTKIHTPLGCVREKKLFLQTMSQRKK